VAPNSVCVSAKEQSAPRLAELEAWLRDERSRLSRSASVAAPIPGGEAVTTK
jgi:hypothetical protein